MKSTERGRKDEDSSAIHPASVFWPVPDASRGADDETYLFELDAGIFAVAGPHPDMERRPALQGRAATPPSR
jgi:hypothetical protein